MQPIRIKIAHSLIVKYQLYREMTIYQPSLACDKDFWIFHKPEYVNFLNN